MGQKYTQPVDPTEVDPVEVAASLRSAIADGRAFFDRVTDEETAAPLAPGKWSRKQTVGHLIDSASNNQQRLVRLLIEPGLVLPAYQQDRWVAVQRYDLRPWAELVDLWAAMNHHLAHTAEQADRACLTRTWQFEGEEITLGFLLVDYVAHLLYHLRKLPGFVEAGA